MNFLADEKHVKIIGRSLLVNGIRYLSYSCSAIEFKFIGRKAEAVLVTDGAKGEENLKAWVAVFVNSEETPYKRFSLNEEESTYTLYESEKVDSVTIRLVKMSEAAFSKVGIKLIMTDSLVLPEPTEYLERKIEFIGDSITCGYGNEGVWNKDTFCTGQENPWNAYAAKTARFFHAEYHLICWSGIGVISNWVPETEDKPQNNWLMPMIYQHTDAGFFGEANLRNSEMWNHDKFVPDLIVINLGTNDTSYTRRIKEREAAFGREYYKFLEAIRAHNASAVILCTLGVMGQELCSEIQEQVERFKNDKKDSNVYFMEFDVQKENDGIGSDWHPSLLTHQKMSEQLIEKVKDIMKW